MFNKELKEKVNSVEEEVRELKQALAWHAGTDIVADYHRDLTLKQQHQKEDVEATQAEIQAKKQVMDKLLRVLENFERTKTVSGVIENVVWTLRLGTRTTKGLEIVSESVCRLHPTFPNPAGVSLWMSQKDLDEYNRRLKLNAESKAKLEEQHRAQSVVRDRLPFSWRELSTMAADALELNIPQIEKVVLEARRQLLSEHGNLPKTSQIVPLNPLRKGFQPCLEVSFEGGEKQ